MPKQLFSSPLPITLLLFSVLISACQATKPSPTPELTPEEIPLESTATSDTKTDLAVDTDFQPTLTPSPTPMMVPSQEVSLEDTPVSSTGTALPTATQLPPTPSRTPGLILEEYPLEGPPDSDAGTFSPIGTSQETVLAKRKNQREKTVYNRIYQAEGEVYPRTDSLGPGPEYTAVLEDSDSEPFRQSVTIYKDDQYIFSVDAGLPSPILPLQGLWSTPGRWVLEVCFIDEGTQQGRVFQNGDFLNYSLGYQDIFGFQLLAEKNFYFFEDESGLGYSYDDQITRLPYEEIIHYGCCSAATLNPITAERMVAFFATTGEDWFYVELGDFSQD
jgi:hypothetical protein